MPASRQRAAAIRPWLANVSSEMKRSSNALWFYPVWKILHLQILLTLLLGILNFVLLKLPFPGYLSLPLVLSVSTKFSSHSYSPGPGPDAVNLRSEDACPLPWIFCSCKASIHFILLQCINGGSTPALVQYSYYTYFSASGLL